MMFSILNKLYTNSPKQAIDDIVSCRESNGHCVVHFLYFANAIKENVFNATVIPSVPWVVAKKCPWGAVEGSYMIDQDLSTSPHSAQDDINKYRLLLQSADFLLPDGIALQLFYRFAVKTSHVNSKTSWLSNCNGTDITLPLLESLPSGTVVHIYGWTQEVINKSKQFLSDKWYHVGIVSNGYQSLDTDVFDDYDWAKQVLLVWRWTPLQEIWVHENKNILQKHKILTLSVWGLFDFWAGEEKRAPRIFRGWAEWLRRLSVNPRKNAIKVRYSLYLPYAIIRYLLLKR